MLKILFGALLLGISLTCVTCGDKGGGSVTWKDFMVKAKWGTKKFIDRLQPYIVNHYPSMNISEQCTKSLIRYAHDLQEWKPWAVKMADATAKLPSGLIAGTRLEFGTFEECIDIRAKSNELTEAFKGQFCMLHMQSPLFAPISRIQPNGKTYVETYGYPPDWIADMIEEYDDMLSTYGIYLGICTPALCTPDDLHVLFSTILKPADVRVKLTDCQVDEPKKWTYFAIACVCIIVCIFGACIIGTVMDINDRSNTEGNNSKIPESTNRKMLKSFSIRTNTEKLFTFPKTSHPLDCLNGIRVIMCLWVIIAHIFVYPSLWKENRFNHFHRLYEVMTLGMVFVENTVINIENFYFLSGFLMTYILWRKLENSGGNLNLYEIIVQKYWRFAPTHLFIIILTFVAPYLYNGPIWNSTWEEEMRKCSNVGWMNVLFINNFASMTEICWLHTWYIGASMQIQIFSLYLMVLTYKRPKLGITIGGLTMVGCILHDFIVSYTNGFLFPSPIVLRSFDFSRVQASKLYMQTFHHVPSHTVGMIVGWAFLKHGHKKISKVYYTIGWILYPICTLSLLYAIRLPTRNLIIAAIHNSLIAILWTLCLAWLIYACATGFGGFLNKFFSLKVFIPLSQIGYSVYLIQPFLYIYSEAARRDKIFLGNFQHFEEFLASVAFSFTGAFIVYLTVEAPFNNMCTVWQRRSAPAPVKAGSVPKTETKNLVETTNAKDGKPREKEL